MLLSYGSCATSPIVLFEQQQFLHERQRSCFGLASRLM